MSRYTDAELRKAVASARSWRGVLRELGLPPQSASALRSARRRADALGLDYGPFTGQRRWSDGDLASAVQASHTWPEVLERLGLATTSGSVRSLLRSHAARLGLDIRHLTEPRSAEPGNPFSAAAGLRHLDRAAPLLAASWFTLRGYEVSRPLEPCRYDLVVFEAEKSFRGAGQDHDDPVRWFMGRTHLEHPSARRRDLLTRRGRPLLHRRWRLDVLPHPTAGGGRLSGDLSAAVHDVHRGTRLARSA